MKYLLDSNVLSEWWKPSPDANVAAFLERGGWLVPSPVIAEIQEGKTNRNKRVGVRSARIEETSQ